MKNRRNGRRGHVLLELALSAGVLVTTLAGTFQFGYAFYVYNQLVTAIGNGAKYASQRSYRAASPEEIEKGRLAIRNLIVYGDSKPATDARPIVPNLTPDQIRVEWVPGDNGAPSAVDISLTEYPVNGIFGTVTLNNRPAVEFPFLGRYAPDEREP